MAAMFGHMDYWNMPEKNFTEELKKALRATPTGQAIFMSICYVFLSITSTVGNAFVIAAVWKDPLKTLRSSPSNFILLSLALADLLVGVVVAPGEVLLYIFVAIKKQIEQWNFLFQLMVLSHFFQLTVSVFHVVLLTIDRFFALAKPLKYKVIVTKKRVAVGSFSIWAFSFCYSILSVILKEHFFVLWFVYVFVIWFFTEGASCLYLVTLRYLHKYHKKRFIDDGTSQSNQVLLHQREMKVFMIILSIMIVTLYLCYLPWLITQFLLFFCVACHVQYSGWIVCYHVATLFLFLNSALNPLLYAWRFSKFRATFKYFLNKCSFQKGPARRKTIKITEDMPKVRQTYDTKL